MAIKNSDGTIYTISKPNPVMVQMNRWDKSKVKLINFGNNKTHTQKGTTINNVAVIPKERIVPDFIRELEETKPKENVLPSTPPAPVIIAPAPELVATKKETSQVEEALNKYGINFFCAPVISHFENKPTYGAAIIIKAIVIEESDLRLAVWVGKELNKDSIIMKKQGVAQRWWKINGSQPKTGGFILLAIPSDINPDFSGS